MTTLARRNQVVDLSQVAMVVPFSSRAMKRHRAAVNSASPPPFQRLSTDLAFRMDAVARMMSLTARQTQVLDYLLTGASSKMIAFEMGVSQRTIEHHRMAIARRFGARSLVELVHAATCARCTVAGPSPAVAPPCPACDEQRTLDSRARLLPAAEDFTSATIAAQETQHRIKNMATVIMSMCHQVARQTETKLEFDKCFSDRVAAYCRSLDQMIENDWDSTSLSSVVALQLETFGGVGSAQIAASGPPVDVPPAAVQNLGLALHELATNAVKYGALSNGAGKVHVSWSVSHETRPRIVRLVWSETGGPAVIPTTAKSFGSLLLDKLVAAALNGTSRHDRNAAGVVWTLSFPIA